MPQFVSDELDYWKCPCGNTEDFRDAEMQTGFGGRNVEYVIANQGDDEEEPPLAVCGRCRRVFVKESGLVVGMMSRMEMDPDLYAEEDMDALEDMDDHLRFDPESDV